MSPVSLDYTCLIKRKCLYARFPSFCFAFTDIITGQVRYMQLYLLLFNLFIRHLLSASWFCSTSLEKNVKLQSSYSYKITVFLKWLFMKCKINSYIYVDQAACLSHIMVDMPLKSVLLGLFPWTWLLVSLARSGNTGCTAYGVSFLH